MAMTDRASQPLNAELWQRLGNLIANLAHPTGDHRANALEDEAHDLIRTIRLAGGGPESPSREGAVLFAWRHGLAGRIRQHAAELVESGYSSNDAIKPLLHAWADELDGPNPLGAALAGGVSREPRDG